MRTTPSLFYVLVFLFGITRIGLAGPTVFRSGQFHATTFTINFNTTDLFNKSGLNGAVIEGVSDFDTVVSNVTHLTDGVSAWSTRDLVGPDSIDIDLGATFAIEKFAIWNAQSDPLSGGNLHLRNIGVFEVYTDDNSTFASPTLVGTFSNPTQTDAAAIQANSFDIVDTNARYVRVRIFGNHGSPNFTQAGEFGFGTSANPVTIPEPSSLILLGLVGVAYCALRVITKKAAV